MFNITPEQECHKMCPFLTPSPNHPQLGFIKASVTQSTREGRQFPAALFSEDVAGQLLIKLL